VEQFSKSFRSGLAALLLRGRLRRMFDENLNARKLDFCSILISFTLMIADRPFTRRSLGISLSANTSFDVDA